MVGRARTTQNRSLLETFKMLPMEETVARKLLRPQLAARNTVMENDPDVQLRMSILKIARERGEGSMLCRRVGDSDHRGYTPKAMSVMVIHPGVS